MKPICLIPTAAGLLFAVSSASAATPLPIWNGDPGTTRNGFLFDTPSTTPTANIDENDFGDATALITVGPNSGGYNDASDPIALSGNDADGAWALDRFAGDPFVGIEVTVPFEAPALGSLFTLEFQAYTVVYSFPGIAENPNFSATGHTIRNATFMQETVAADPGFPGASYVGLTYTGFIDNVSPADGPITFQFATEEASAVITDRTEVFTRATAVPEPSSALLALGGLAVLFRRRR